MSQTTVIVRRRLPISAIFTSRAYWAGFGGVLEKAFVIPNPSDVHILLYELKHGNLWSGVAIQDDEVARMAKKGLLYCVLHHSHSERPVYRRVIVHERSNP